MVYCSNCFTEVALDQSLIRLNKDQLNLLVSKAHKCDQKGVPVPTLSHYTPQDRLERYHQAIAEAEPKPMYNRNLIESESDDDEDEVDFGVVTTDHQQLLDDLDTSFIMLSDESAQIIDDIVDNPDTISKRIKVLTQIFNILSSSTRDDHPLSKDCADLLVENYKNKFDQTQQEKENYGHFLAKLKDKAEAMAGDATDSKLTEARDQHQQAKQQEATKLEELTELEAHKCELETQLQSLQAELDRLQSTELEAALIRKNLGDRDVALANSRLDQAQSVYQSRLDHLDRLRNINIYHLLFQIEDIGGYPSINGLRIGHRVVWSEINAALGQVVLLLVFLIKKLSVNLTNYKLVPIGSKSQIIKYSAGDNDSRTRTVLNLYSSNEFSLGRLFNFNKMDVSMIALVEICIQIQQRLHELDPEIELPYKMTTQGYVGGKSVRATSNTEWTTGCSHLLINLKWILTWVKTRR